MSPVVEGLLKKAPQNFGISICSIGHLTATKNYFEKNPTHNLLILIAIDSLADRK